MQDNANSPKNGPVPARRVACLWFPDWPLQYRLAAVECASARGGQAPFFGDGVFPQVTPETPKKGDSSRVMRRELARAVLLLTEKTARGEFVAFANRLAVRRGIRPGMPLTEARSLVARRDVVQIEPMQPEADRAALEAMALSCERYSPCVGIEEGDSPQSLLLDMTGIAHLFGGETSLTDLMQTELAERHFAVRIALAESVGAAWAAAHYYRTPALARGGQSPFFGGDVFSQATSESPKKGDSPQVAPEAPKKGDSPLAAIIPSGQLDALLDLPIEGLRLGAATVEKLHRLGIRSIRQVCNLKRSSLAARFGAEIARRLDQFAGVQTELIVPCRPLPKFVEQSLETGIARLDLIEEWRGVLLRQLAGMLQEHRLGTRHLTCQLTTDRKTKHEVAIRFCEATADARQMGELLRLRFERFRLDGPLVGMRMEALETSRIEQPQQEFFDGASYEINVAGTLRAPSAESERPLQGGVPNAPLNRSSEISLAPDGTRSVPTTLSLAPTDGTRSVPTTLPGRHELNRQLSSLLDRLSSRLGSQSTVRPRLVPEAVPERAVEYVPVTDAAAQTATVEQRFEPLDRPPCLLPEPQAVEVIAVVPDGPPAVLFFGNARFDVAQSWGPERIETGWWQGPIVRREYFHIATTDGRRFWLFRRIADGRWFVQGGMW
jgi:nucleotidyltransferase/DNA polymerase involved in DNA repair